MATNYSSKDRNTPTKKNGKKSTGSGSATKRAGNQSLPPTMRRHPRSGLAGGGNGRAPNIPR